MSVPRASTTLRRLASNVLLVSIASLALTNVYAQNDTASSNAQDSVIAGHEAIIHTSEPATDNEQAQPLSKYTCSLNGLTRRIEISYASDTAAVPCDVNYYKDTEAPNEINTLWSAQNLSGYCEQKASEFVEKLQSWGWECAGS